MLRENEGRTALVELSFTIMGLMKLLGLQTRLFRRMGLPPRSMRKFGLFEAGGAMLVANPETRAIGGAGLAAISAMMLVVELRSREAELVLPRLALTALAAMIAVSACRSRAVSARQA
ncbi:DoxX family protein [Acidisphaera sp. L21]|uniref:DoxX family protein n=1 Tax=Acidisphaera sp. L21 TaxID=1641851 RepID=UPI00131CCEFF|nr:DoxX family protein [Acidisphaera sp. L21]